MAKQRKARRPRPSEGIDYQTAEIPDFLKLTAEQRAKAWEGVKVTGPVNWTDPVAAKQEHLRQAHAEQNKEKARHRIARLKDQHEGMRYDQKEEAWVPDRRNPTVQGEIGAMDSQVPTTDSPEQKETGE